MVGAGDHGDCRPVGSHCPAGGECHRKRRTTAHDYRRHHQGRAHGLLSLCGAPRLHPFRTDINVPVYFIIDAAAHPNLVARLDDLALLGFIVAAFHAVIIVLVAILLGLLDVKTSMVATLVCYWGMGLGLTVLFVEILRLDFWYSLLAVVIALTTSTAVIALRLHLRLSMPRDAA